MSCKGGLQGGGRWKPLNIVAPNEGESATTPTGQHVVVSIHCVLLRRVFVILRVWTHQKGWVFQTAPPSGQYFRAFELRMADDGCWQTCILEQLSHHARAFFWYGF